MNRQFTNQVIASMSKVGSMTVDHGEQEEFPPTFFDPTLTPKERITAIVDYRREVNKVINNSLQILYN